MPIVWMPSRASRRHASEPCTEDGREEHVDGRRHGEPEPRQEARIVQDAAGRIVHGDDAGEHDNEHEAELRQHKHAAHHEDPALAEQDEVGLLQEDGAAAEEAGGDAHADVPDHVAAVEVHGEHGHRVEHREQEAEQRWDEAAPRDEGAPPIAEHANGHAQIDAEHEAGEQVEEKLEEEAPHAPPRHLETVGMREYSKMAMAARSDAEDGR
ncbi:hypothetical protein SYNPS1DRAFT_31820 [Syncephalis pseudoplumigaleata]|uniref:Uncharacterized protein n=1 Tax=Syncephalis pseudoplumigaleata TaxID=1712513 RepID=A0A4P9YTS5_9FUNG|nr:hypothetical protein SYNPS1DRAFT_31820 [Syncephalis pseudoplumigaleata]|eukprot:RKP22571.1 hypothetical protein SYNPS1DRAFT_31820 [Syncephalis pseudoplumigaleata]